jgi:hypothetical protein
MSKQTAVEYLLQEFSEIIGRVNFTVTQDLFIRDAVIKAKEMEKENIKQAYNDGKAAVIHIENNMSLEEYYNKTFKNKIK